MRLLVGELLGLEAPRESAAHSTTRQGFQPGDAQADQKPHYFLTQLSYDLTWCHEITSGRFLIV